VAAFASPPRLSTPDDATRNQQGARGGCVAGAPPYVLSTDDTTLLVFEGTDVDDGAHVAAVNVRGPELQMFQLYRRKKIVAGSTGAAVKIGNCTPADAASGKDCLVLRVLPVSGRSRHHGAERPTMTSIP